MVSTDHFRQELLAQLGRAATQGRIDILINSGELYRSIAKGGFPLRFLLRRHARGVQDGRYAASRPDQRCRDDSPLSSTANRRHSNQSAAQIKLGHWQIQFRPQGVKTGQRPAAGAVLIRTLAI